MRVKSSSNSTRVSNSIYKRKANQSSSSSTSSSLNGSYILEKHVRRRRILPKSPSNLDETSTTNHLTNDIANDKIAESLDQPKELEFIDNPTIVEYYTNNRKDNNKNICVLNYCNLLKNYIIAYLAYVCIFIVSIFMCILSYFLYYFSR